MSKDAVVTIANKVVVVITIEKDAIMSNRRKMVLLLGDQLNQGQRGGQIPARADTCKFKVLLMLMLLIIRDQINQGQGNHASTWPRPQFQASVFTDNPI